MVAGSTQIRYALRVLSTQRSTHYIGQCLTGVALMIGCVIASLIIANLFDIFRPGTLLQGRDFHRTAVLSAVHIACVGLWWYRVRSGRLWMMLGALGLVEVLVCALIVFFSGSYKLDLFFWDWFLGINTYIALPWVASAGLGFLWQRRSRGNITAVSAGGSAEGERPG